MSATVFAVDAYDPSAAAGRVAWQRPDGIALIIRGGGIEALRGSHPALGGERLAWRDGAGTITVAEAATSAVLARHAAPDAGVLAIGGDLVAWRARDAFGVDRLWVLGPAGTGVLAQAIAPEELGRPAIAGGRVLIHVSGPRGSRLLSIDPAVGTQTVLRSEPGAQVSNPASDGTRLLYVRATGRDQQLRLGPLAPSPVERDQTVLVHASPGQRDVEHEPGRRRHNHGKRRPRLPPRALPGVVDTLWGTALDLDAAYVTRLRVRRGAGRTADVLRVALAATG